MSDNEATKRRFLEFARTGKMRLTSQRQAIIDAVFETNKHFTAEELCQWARKRDNSVSRATVYRTLPLLTASGLVREMDFGKNYKFYDPNYADNPNHNHIICQDCNKIIEFESDKIGELETELSRKFGITIKSHRVQIVATCDQFRQCGLCDRNPEAKRPNASEGKSRKNG
jgi:Fur family ferric uptake transcriptional regulator